MLVVEDILGILKAAYHTVVHLMEGNLEVGIALVDTLMDLNLEDKQVEGLLDNLEEGNLKVDITLVDT